MAEPPRSFVAVDAESHFPIHNLPFGVFHHPALSEPRVGVAIGDWVLDVRGVDEAGFFAGTCLEGAHAFAEPALNDFMAMGRPTWREARRVLQKLLSADEPTLRDDAELRERLLFPRGEVEMLLPCEIGDYTDFYSSKQHATNLGTMLRGPENPLLPNWHHLPVAYHGRASSVVVSGTPIRRPLGQSRSDDAAPPSFGPTRALDFELEVGFFVGTGNPLGEPIPIHEAEEHIFGFVLVNDWSARDIQKWEYQPLGPFLGKNFATSISPWVVMLEALEPFRVPGPIQDPTPFPYLRSDGPAAFNIRLEVFLETESSNARRLLSVSNFQHLYWNVRQQLAHHTVNGCNLRPGDLLASGTISGSTPDSLGSLIELTWKGTRPLELPGGERRVFLQDGDQLTLTGWCQGESYRVGFGEVTGRILPAISLDE
jgi:fumarylacetoacetase